MDLPTSIKSFLIVFLFLGVYQVAQAQDPARFQQSVDQITKANAGLPPSENLIIFTGSSSIRGWKDIAAYFPDKNILNHGFGGSQTSDLIHYADELILDYKPKKVFIYEGDNDISAGKSTEVIMKDINTLVGMINEASPRTEIFLISAKPSISRWHLQEKYLDLNQKMKEYSQARDKVEYVDIWTTMLDETGKPKADIFLEDKLHMNKAGYDLWAEVIKEYVD